MAYRDDPDIAAIADSTRDDEVAIERLKLLHEGGWGSFLKKRDAMYRDNSQ